MTRRQTNGNYPIKRADRKPNEKKKSYVRDLWDNIKQANLSITGIPEGKGKGD